MTINLFIIIRKTEKGNELNAWMIKPKDFDPNKKYPVFMYQYSGPGSQQVNNDWNGADALQKNRL